jgi:hypothetical protein
MTTDVTQFFANANVQLLPYFEQASLASLYDPKRPWEGQRQGVAATVIPMFKCPSSAAPNPLYNDLFTDWGGPSLGVTEYAFCMGATDAFCARPGVKAGDIPPLQQGIFNIAWGASIRQITDGTSNTIAMGESSGDPRWRLCHLAKCTEAELSNGPLGELPFASIGWIVSEPNHTKYFVLLGPQSSVYAATVEPINKYPATDTFLSFPQYALDYKNFKDGVTGHVCRASYDGGGHSVSNFRSDHPGGCNLLMSDSSVRFFNETVDLVVFRGYSTIAGEEVPGPL